ncbi:hypothetical protein Tco_1564436 [Tanacetum coccineum]
MSDSDESGVTYTEISSTFEELSDIGSPGVLKDTPIILCHKEDEGVSMEEGRKPEEDDDEDPVDYHADGGDDGDDEDDEDDDMDIDADDDDEEEEHPAPADSVVVALPATDQAPSAEETEPFETNVSAATPPPHPAYRVTARISIPSLVPNQYGIALGPTYEVEESSSAAAARLARGLKADYGFCSYYVIRRSGMIQKNVGYGITGLLDEIDTDEIYTRLDDEQSGRQLLVGRLNMLFRDRRAHTRTTRLMETEARMSREAWGRSMDASDLARAEVISLRTIVLAQQSQIRELQSADRMETTILLRMLAQITKMAPKRATRSNIAPETTNTTSVTNAQLQAMINQGVTTALASRDANTNGVDSHNSGTGHFKRECPKLMNNNNRGNQVGGGNALAKVYAVGHVGINPDSNIVMELGSFNAIIGMDWLVKYQAIIVCAEKIVRIPWGNETLIVHGDGSNQGREARLHIISLLGIYEDSSKDFQRLPNHEPSSLSKKDKLSAVTNKKQRFQLVEAKLLSAIKIVEIRYSPQEKPNVDADGLKAVRTRSHIKDSTLSHDYRVLEKVGSVAYKLELPEELSRVHNTFHVSNLKKCHADEPLAVPLDGLHFDDKLQFVEEPVEIMDREVKRLKRSRIPLVKVRWNSKRGPEFTWERDQIQFRRNTTPLHKTAPSQVPRLMEKTQNKPKELLPYGMLLTRLFKHIVSVFPELAIDHYLSHDRVMHPFAPHYERKTRPDHGKKRPRESNASSSYTTLNHPSSSRPLDDIVDENDEESFHSNSSSPSQNVSSSSNVVSRVRQNPPHESSHLNTYLSEIINLQTQQ